MADSKHSVGVVILASGIGQRTGLSMPKQFFLLEQKEVLFHTLEQYIKTAFISVIVLVVHPSYVDRVEKSIKEKYQEKNIIVISGGVSRKASVYAGLVKVSDLKCEFVIVQDAVRPFVSVPMIEGLYQASQKSKNGAAIVGIKSGDLSVKVVDGDIVQVMDKSTTYLSQSPECYKTSSIIALHRKSKDIKELDEATNLELMIVFGEGVALFYSEAFNQKITYSHDLEVYKKLFRP